MLDRLRGSHVFDRDGLRPFHGVPSARAPRDGQRVKRLHDRQVFDVTDARHNVIADVHLGLRLMAQHSPSPSNVTRSPRTGTSISVALDSPANTFISALLAAPLSTHGPSIVGPCSTVT